MSTKLIKNITKIIILTLTVIILCFKTNKDFNEKEIKKDINKTEIKEETEEIKEVLEENINLFIPPLKDKCEIDNCMTNTTYSYIKNHLFDNNYEEIIKDGLIYFKNGSNLIKFTFIEENTDLDELNENKREYDYILNRYTTKDDINKLLNKKTISTYTGEKATKIPVLNYHFFYDKKEESCNESICLDISKFEEQLKYLKDNNYKTLTIEEYKSWFYKEIDLPKKSVLITIDDGAMGTSKINGNKLIPLLEKYEVNATLFLITGWWKKENYESFYLDIQSHTNLMHEEKICSNKERGAALLCSSKEEIKKDLEASISKVDNNISFCFPFYLYDNKSIEVLKELDFKLAFVGGNRKSTQNDNKYTIPRYIIYKNITLNTFKNYIN